ncbi:MAG: hypothetical protein IT384_16285 [Deltaproteobacteria bacterium]|nr:hypothetical protein [Deltaproteobacteria bacterium]
MERPRESFAAPAERSAGPLRAPLRALIDRFARLFPRSRESEAVVTAMQFPVPPETVWKGMMFYEDVPTRPFWFLRAFLPSPVRSEGEKTRVGASIRCTYDDGHLIKRMTEVEPARGVRFDVIEQNLGLEGCITMQGGSYEIRAQGGGSEVVLTTRYFGHLRPRFFWRLFERYLAHRVHRHILDGMRALPLLSAPPPP